MASRVVSAPLMRPTNAPVPRPASAPTNQKLARCDIASAAAMPESASVEATDKVDLARDDDERHADRDDRHERRLPADVEKIVDRQEPWRSEAEDDEQDDEGEIEHPRPFAAQQRLRQRRGAARLLDAAVSTCCGARRSVMPLVPVRLADLDELVQTLQRRRIPSRPSVAFTRPSTTIEMRSQSRINSLRSDEAISAPAPLPTGAADEAVDLLARADVDADGRLVEQQDARARIVPFGEDDLLLVAAGKVSDADRRPGRLDREPCDRLLRLLPSPRRGAPSSPKRNAASRGRLKLRSIEWSRTRPCTCRSSGTSAMPSSIASAGPRKLRASPRIRSSPRVERTEAEHASRESPCARCRSVRQGRGSPHPSA